MTTGGGSEGRWSPKFRSFFHLTLNLLCVVSLGVFSLNFGGVWGAATLQITPLGYLAIV